MKKHKKKFIGKAIKHPGALTRVAEKEHETPHEFAEEHKGSAGKTGRRARLALTLQKLAKHRHHRKRKMA